MVALFIILLLVVANAFCVAAEFAAVTVRKSLISRLPTPTWRPREA